MMRTEASVAGFCDNTWDVTALLGVVSSSLVAVGAVEAWEVRDERVVLDDDALVVSCD